MSIAAQSFGSVVHTNAKTYNVDGRAALLSGMPTARCCAILATVWRYASVPNYGSYKSSSGQSQTIRHRLNRNCGHCQNVWTTAPMAANNDAKNCDRALGDLQRGAHAASGHCFRHMSYQPPTAHKSANLLRKGGAAAPAAASAGRHPRWCDRQPAAGPPLKSATELC
jgi:hypothetical protein